MHLNLEKKLKNLFMLKIIFQINYCYNIKIK
jgi:hypothetical protein